MEKQALEQIAFIIGDGESLIHIREQEPFAAFSRETCAFPEALSDALMREKTLRRAYPELTALAFWLRRAHLDEMKRVYAPETQQTRRGKRVSLHFASSNIPLLFAYTMAAGLLSGSSCIIRLPGKEREQERVLVEIMRQILEETMPWMKKRLILCRYGHEKSCNDLLSGLCDVRILWGSSGALAEIGRSPLPEGAEEILFGPRKSASILKAEVVAETEDLDLFVRDFYNDTYLNDQNACSSPQILYWVGEPAEIEKARERFREELRGLLRKRAYQVPAVLAVQKLDAAFRCAAQYEGTRIVKKDNRLVCVEVEALTEQMWELTVPGGYFIEACGPDQKGILPVLTKQCQTLTWYGLTETERENLQVCLSAMPERGVYRMVPCGHALDFSLTWDGINLVEVLSSLQLG